MAGPRISDHALVRILERAGGIDVEALRASFQGGLTRAHEAARKLGSSDYLITIDGLIYVVRDGTVTTVQTSDCAGQRGRALGRAGHEK